MNLRLLIGTVCLCVCLTQPWTAAHAAEPNPIEESFWGLIHEPSVIEGLQLSDAQKRQVQSLTDGLDLRYFPLRNQKTETALPSILGLVSEARTGLDEILTPAQQTRLRQIEFRHLGTNSFLHPEMQARLRLTDDQFQKIVATIKDHQLRISNKLTIGRDEKASPETLKAEVMKLSVAEQRAVLNILTTSQTTAWKIAIGPEFNFSQLGNQTYKAPELIDTGSWLNTAGLTPEALKGKVVVIHFYACGCINCTRNAPAMQDWQTRFKDQPFVMVGIHTPETQAERQLDMVRQKATGLNLTFPILIDNDKQNWNAWGNSMWPTVYVVDKRGMLRQFWAGELNWQGATGEIQMRSLIEKLLAEPAP